MYIIARRELDLMCVSCLHVTTTMLASVLNLPNPLEIHISKRQPELYSLTVV